MPVPLPPKSGLLDLQRAMAGAVMRPLTSSEEMQRGNAQVARELIKPNDRLDSFERLQIYNQQYWWRLLGNFGEDFRGLRAVIGERKFDRLAIVYLERFPSSSWSLRDLGANLEAFLVAHPELIAPHDSLAREVVRVEWARVVAFDGPEEPLLNTSQLAEIAPDALQIGVQPYVSLLELWHPVDDLLSQLKVAEIETGTLSNAVAATRAPRRKRLRSKRLEAPILLAVHRHQYSVYYKRLEPPAYRLLVALREGQSLGDACAEAFTDEADSAEAPDVRIQSWFATWMGLGWLCAARPAPQVALPYCEERPVFPDLES